MALADADAEAEAEAADAADVIMEPTALDALARPALAVLAAPPVAVPPRSPCAEAMETSWLKTLRSSEL